MAYLERAGVRISHQVTGEQNAGLPVLLSHGFSASAAMWEPNIAAIAATRPVITWDMRGHGNTECPPDPGMYTHANCVQDMAALLDAYGIERAVLGGLSLGGYLSLAFYREFPKRVTAMMLFDTGPGFRSDTARQEWNDRALATADQLDQDGQHGLALAARGILVQADSGIIESLPSVKVPTLVLVGARDRAFLGAADYMAAKIDGAEHAVIPDAGHASNVDQPELFTQRVIEFLDHLDRS